MTVTRFAPSPTGELHLGNLAEAATNYRAAPAGAPDNITDICVYRNMRYQFSTGRIVEERVFAGPEA